MPNLTSSEQTNLFFSYSRKDRERLEQLYTALDGADELNLFRDTDDILPTEEWKPRLEALIKASDTIIFALTPHSVTSKVCRWELEYAESLNKRIIPIVVEDVDFDVPKVVSKLNYIRLTDKEDFEKVLPNILNAISLDIDWIRDHTRLGDMAQRWEAVTRLGAQFLRGKELEAAESWLATQPKYAPPPTQTHRNYILNSRKAATKRQRATVMSSLAVLVVVGVLAGFAWVQRQQAIQQKNTALIVESEFLSDAGQELLSEGTPSKAIEIFRRALPQTMNSSDRPLVVSALVGLEKSLAANRVISKRIHESSRIDAVRYSDKGQFYFEVLSDGSVQKISSKTGDVVVDLRSDIFLDTKQEISRIDIIDANNTLVVSGYEPTPWLKVISLDEMRVVHEPQDEALSGYFGYKASQFSWSSDGRFLSYVGANSKNVYVHDLDKGSTKVIGNVAEFDPSPEDAFSGSAIAISDDGRLVALSIGTWTRTNLVLVDRLKNAPALLQIGTTGSTKSAKVTSLAFIGKENDLLVGYKEGTVAHFDVEKSAFMESIKVDRSEILGISTFGSNGRALVVSKRIVSNSLGGHMAILGVSVNGSESNLRIEQNFNENTYYSAKYCPQLEILAIGGISSIKLWDFSGRTKQGVIVIGEPEGAVTSLSFDDTCEKLVAADRLSSLKTNVLEVSLTPLLLDAKFQNNPFSEFRRELSLPSKYTEIGGDSVSYFDQKTQADQLAVVFYEERDKDFEFPILGVLDRTSGVESYYRSSGNLKTAIENLEFANSGRQLIFSEEVGGKISWRVWNWDDLHDKPKVDRELDDALIVSVADPSGTTVIAQFQNDEGLHYQVTRGAKAERLMGVNAKSMNNAVASQSMNRVAILDGKDLRVFEKNDIEYVPVEIDYSLAPGGRKIIDQYAKIAITKDGRFLVFLSSVESGGRYRDELFKLDLEGSKVTFSYVPGYAYQYIYGLRIDNEADKILLSDGARTKFSFPLWSDRQAMLNYADEMLMKISPLTPSDICRYHFADCRP